MAKKTKTFSLDPEIKEYASNLDNASAVVNDLLEQHKKGSDSTLVALDLQIKQKRQKKQRVKEEYESIERDVAELVELRRQLSQVEDNDLEEAKTKLEGVERDPSNPAIQNWAGKLEMTEVELIEALPQQ